MSASIDSLLKYINLQMAAEAYLSGNSDRLVQELVAGNQRTSKFTEVQATQFSKEWSVVNHIEDTSTGLWNAL